MSSRYGNTDFAKCKIVAYLTLQSAKNLVSLNGASFNVSTKKTAKHEIDQRAFFPFVNTRSKIGNRLAKDLQTRRILALVSGLEMSF